MKNRKKDDFNGKEKTLEEWIDVYCRRAGDETVFVLNPREKIYYHPVHGFFSYVPDYDDGYLMIPKMCGDGRYLRKVVFAFVESLLEMGCKGVKFCSRYHHKGWIKTLGGELVETKDMPNPQTGKPSPMYFVKVPYETCNKRNLIFEKEEEDVKDN